MFFFLNFGLLVYVDESIEEEFRAIVKAELCLGRGAGEELNKLL